MARGSSSVVGVAVLVALVVLAAGTVSLTLTAEPPEPAPVSSFELGVDAGADQISLTHRGGDPIDLTATRFRIEVDGQPLSQQPPIPFFATEGFVSGPTGPFNSASENVWRPGETGRFVVAETNEPVIQPGSRVTVAIITDGTEIAELTVRA